ncbi:MAG: CRTAC1 family protein [Phycisphaerales bacterium]|nr:MAG: CRTAC1 family protein [Phycisphaerales bacterium]
MAISVLAALASGGAAAPQIVLTDVTAQSGITFQHTDGSSGKRYIVETVSAGLALFDYDGDGHIDVYFLNGAPLEGSPVKGRPRNALYRNRGDWTFTDVTERSGLGDTGYGLGVAVGDYDNDGDLDVYLNNYGPNVLYRNNGDGMFTDVTKAAGVDNGAQVGAGACFLDIEGDGDLDLYVSNYLEFSFATSINTMMGGYPTYASPAHYQPVPDTLYRNNGDGTFTDVSAASGIAAHAGWGMGIICADYDNDADTDIFIGNDVAENFLFQNDGNGRFEEIGLLAGTAYKGNGDPSASMGVDSGDYDNDGWLDFYVTSYQQELATLYHNAGDSLFEDVTMQTGAGAGTLPNVTWGNGFVDFDNDGDRDIFVACGHLQDNVDKYDDVTSYHQHNVLLVNSGQGKFIDMSLESGSGLRVKRSSRGAAFDDLDNDGDVDVVVLNSRTEPTLLRNDSPQRGRWLQIQLRGTKTNRDGIGARVTVKAGRLTLTDEVHSGRGYQSHYGARLHFGLGQAKQVDRIEIRWIGGATDLFENVPTNQLITLVEGSS